MLDVRHATVAFSAPGGPLVRAVDDVSFTIPVGTFVVVIGTNGSGKSTLLGAIAGTVRLDAGSIHVAGHDLTRWRENRRARYVGRVFQDPRAGTASSLSVLENIAVAACRGRPVGLGWATPQRLRAEAAQRLAAIQPGLEKRLDQPIGSMSGGQRQAVAVARASVFARKVVILDEPTAALGLRESRKVLDLVAQLRDEGNAVILITHNMEHVTELASRAMVLRQGRKVGEIVPTKSNQQELVSMIVGAATTDQFVQPDRAG